jgi:predicted HicB family RNase H-like nuclease
MSTRHTPPSKATRTTATAATTTEKKATKSLVVSETLHQALKAKAAREGRILQSMVEEKLSELVAPEQLQLVAEATA